MLPENLMGKDVEVSVGDMIYTGRVADVDDEALFVEDGGEKYIIPWQNVLYIAEKRDAYMDYALRREIRHKKLVYVAICFAMMAGGALVGLLVRWLS
ncbi:hypothetical protein AciM339_1225 [Aciduliprofundum sp. MAR08-339]|uniref:hypothetical protein n=1 Tax=Aciduliprofundum sp. (strain MAR08-339) TaxID=673860 RepID=UPI0002A4A267|nr:hypothetical protein AciM339_1225 [Aciduliprofundum sp. MAR08-339]